MLQFQNLKIYFQAPPPARVPSKRLSAEFFSEFICSLEGSVDKLLRRYNLAVLWNHFQHYRPRIPFSGKGFLNHIPVNGTISRKVMVVVSSVVVREVRCQEAIPPFPEEFTGRMAADKIVRRIVAETDMVRLDTGEHEVSMMRAPSVFDSEHNPEILGLLNKSFQSL